MERVERSVLGTRQTCREKWREERGVCWGLDRCAEKNGERSVLGTRQTCREKWRGMESTGDWTDMQKKIKMERGERSVLGTGQTF